jgi:hypothetical protein
MFTIQRILNGLPGNAGLVGNLGQHPHLGRQSLVGFKSMPVRFSFSTHRDSSLLRGRARSFISAPATSGLLQTLLGQQDKNNPGLLKRRYD